MRPKITIIGAGPGGLTSGILLQKRGFDVTIYEKNSRPGGRNQAIKLGDYTFDTGPTFLMMKNFLDEIFSETGRDINDYLEFYDLEPLYTMTFNDKVITHYKNRTKMKAEIEQHFPGESVGYERLMMIEKKRYRRLYPCLQRDYSSPKRMLEPETLYALPYLQLHKTMHQALGSYFQSEDLKIAFTSQAKYFGMSPWSCPALFTMITYLEHEYGLFHVKGGLNQIPQAMANILVEEGGKIVYDTTVKELITNFGEALGVVLNNGEKIYSEDVLINSDFAYTFSDLYKDSKKWPPNKLKAMDYSCSTFMLYLGLDKIYDLPHHSIYLADDYKANVDDINVYRRVRNDFSIYIQNASITDPTLAPEGHSSLYVLVPITNLKSGINWDTFKRTFRQNVIEALKIRVGIDDVEAHIKEEKIITPKDWLIDYNLLFGATFSLSHGVNQMLYYRPHNRFEELENCYLVGGGTHPGSSLPSIYESGRISAKMICKKHGIKY